MKKAIYISIVALLISYSGLYAQNVGIGTTSPDPSAALEVESSNQGFLAPRLNSYHRQNIASPATGLLVFDTDTKSFWYYTGIKWLNLSPAGSKNRSIYIPGNGMSYTPAGAIAEVRWGTSLLSNAGPVGFIVPRPEDWDHTQAFSVTLYYAFPALSTNTFVRWRLLAGSARLNASSNQAGNGWDSYDTPQITDGPTTPVYAAPGRTSLAKSVTWTAKWSSEFNTWYLGVGVSTNNDFVMGPMWHFSFQRGYALSIGETYSGSLVVTGASIDYQGK